MWTSTPTKRRTKHKGRLIALEGARGPLLAPAARVLLARSAKDDQASGVSGWDSSGIFYELKLGKAKKFSPSPRTLLLFYAADLAFRLRWEIGPALEAGLCVVAAPYLEAPLAFAAATGLPRKWVTELLRFAPRPNEVHVLAGNVPSEEKQKPSEGFLEFGISMLKHADPPWDPQELYLGYLDYLSDLEKRGGGKRFPA